MQIKNIYLYNEGKQAKKNDSNNNNYIKQQKKLKNFTASTPKSWRAVEQEQENFQNILKFPGNSFNNCLTGF